MPAPVTGARGSLGQRPSAAVFDIDGVLADVRHRLHHVAAQPKDWNAFFSAAVDDPPLHEGVTAVATAHHSGHVVVYLTGRPERCRADTVAWLAAQGLPGGEVLMRRDADRRPARVTKVVALRLLADRFRVVTFVDDDAAVVAEVRRAGFPVRHARWMATSTSGADSAPPPTGDESAQALLFEIQETDART